jgi:NAD(P)-dependent dehydrogenase (short-subunit alcohol dehydrogenase family)
MVKAATVQQSNADFARAHHDGLICVFAGATSGIGAGTLERMVQMLNATTFYVLGRSEARFASQRANLESLNPSCKFVFLEVNVSLISGVDAACKQIAAAEKKVDYLFMSHGAVPYAGAQCMPCYIPTPLAEANFEQTRKKVSNYALHSRTTPGCGSS